MSDTLREEIREKIVNGDYNCEKELTLFGLKRKVEGRHFMASGCRRGAPFQ
jgi:hypothetical protein